MNRKKLLCIGLAAVIACTNFLTMDIWAQERQAVEQQEQAMITSDIRESNNVFQIEDGILVNYTGEGGDVVIPEGVTYIDSEAFAYCSSLTSIIIPGSVIYIGDRAFESCSSLTNVIIPNSVMEIEYLAFEGCSSLASITIPDSVTRIGWGAFRYCSSLTRVTIPDSVTDIGGLAFSDTPWLENERAKTPFVVINNILIDAQTTSGNVVIPEGITCIGESAFRLCDELTDITIPKSVTRIGEGAFFLSSLTSITIPKGVTHIEKDVFNSCRLTNITIPDSVISIEERAFFDCDNLTSITIPKSVTNIGREAFFNCYSLTSITIPESVIGIGRQAFSGTPWFESQREKNPLVIINHILYDGQTASGDVVIPESVTSIEESAFEDCSSLTSVTIPRGVTYIGDYAFDGCADGFTLIVYAGSYAETYAKDNDIPYRYVEGSTHTHSYQNQITIQPGCTTAGVRTYTCSGCGNSYTETIVATGHKYTKATTNPTCTAKGAVTYTCSVCKHSYKEEIAALGHKYTKTTKNPTCTAKGIATYTCSACKHSYTETIAALGHKYKKTTKNPTCTAKGAVVRTCSVCKYSYTEKTLPATGHKYVTTTVAATLKKNGAVTTSCKVCKTKKQTIIYAPKTVSLSKTESIYNGKQKKPKVNVKDRKGKTLRKGRDYTVTYQKNMKNVGTRTVTVRFKGNYRGTTKIAYVINPKGTAISKVKPKEKGFDLKWKKQKKQISGYEIAYSTSNKFTKKSTKTVKVGKGKTSVSIAKLKAKKKYYIRIRTYKTVKGKKYYSEWSKVKSVTTKK